MVKLITLLATGLPAFMSVVLAWLARKWGTAAATIALFIVLTVAMVSCIMSILALVQGLLSPPGWITNALGMFVPADFVSVLSAIMSAKTCRAAYDLAMLKARMFNTAT